MKYSTIAVIAFSGFAAAQSSLPVCAQPCIATAVAAETDCTIEDKACQCEPANKLAIQTAATSCVLTACAEKALDVLAAANAACEALEAEPTTTGPSSATDTSPPINPDTSSINPSTVSGSVSISIIEETTTLAPTGTPSPRPSYAITNSTTTRTSTSTVSTTASGTTSATSTVPTGAAAKMVMGGVGGVFAFGLALLAGL